MKQEHSEIISLIIQYLGDKPFIRFGQALTNLGILEFKDKINPENADHALRDIFADSDGAILNRMKKIVEN